jgi:hypothetical protein
MGSLFHQEGKICATGYAPMAPGKRRPDRASAMELCTHILVTPWKNRRDERDPVEGAIISTTRVRVKPAAIEPLDSGSREA